MSHPQAKPLPASPLLDRPGSGTVARRVGRRSLRLTEAAGAWMPALAVLAILGLVALTVLVVADATLLHSPAVPSQPKVSVYPRWLAGGRLSYYTFLPALLGITAFYALVLALARHVRGSWALLAILVVHLLVFLGPVLLSQDLFSYLAYARDGVRHGINPYLHGPSVLPHEPVYRYVGLDWKRVLTAYGPLWTVLSYPFGALGLRGGVWGLKAVGVLSSLAVVGLVWRCAQLRGRDPVFPALLVGLSPITVLYSAAGAHNDLLMAAIMMAGVLVALRGRQGAGAASVVAGAAVKATAAVVVPFMVLGERKLRPLAFAVLTAVVIGAVSVLVFGSHSLDVAATLRRQQGFVSSDSFPNELAHLLGKPGVFPVDRLLLRVGLVAIVAYLLWVTWRGYDWVAAAGWTMLAIAVTTTWLLPWYTIWAIPLAAVSRDRRLLWATLGVQGLFLAHQLSPLLSPRL